MDNRSEIRDFLVTRRARITPEQVGLPSAGGRRRVPGLRREEVAVLADVSTEWYTRLVTHRQLVFQPDLVVRESSRHARA
ncbi:MAG TPA: hypothetical protein VFR23_23170 [Jiangellaceae bacterium]|nr:hypothetical protein [Jiangellaceae bacterium]